MIKRRVEKKREYPEESLKRIDTLFSIFSKATYILLAGIAITIILDVFGVNVGTILTAAGVFGLAISFGAQNSVRDVISVIFMLAENQVRKGDSAIINSTGGLVEAVNLGTIVLRDFEEVVHIFPNGSISTFSNKTKEWSAMAFDIGVAYKEDPDKVMDVMNKVAEELRNDEKFKDFILESM